MILHLSSAPDRWGESSQNVTGCTVHCEQKNDSKIEVEPPESKTHSKYLSDIVSRLCIGMVLACSLV